MDWYVIWDNRSSLIDGLELTIELSALGIALSTAVGTLIGSVSTLPAFLLQRLTGAYVEVLRNVPLVVKLFFVHFIVGLDAFPAAVIALTLHQSAYIADVTAAGLRSIPRGQTEAALSCGHSYAEALRYVVLPQAIRNVIPPLTTQYVQVVKNSSVAMFIALEDLAFMTQKIQEETYRNFEAATATTFIYLALALVVALAMSGLQHVLERKPA